MEEKKLKGICTDLTHEGLGVLKVEDKPYFINDLLPNEKAEFIIINENKNYGFGKVIKRLNDSPKRIVPKCASFGKCGGCDLCHISYSGELEFKLKMVNETLKRIGHIDYKIKDIIGADNEECYRNKVQIPFKQVYGKVICGFYKKKTHEIIEIKKCNLQTDLTTDIAIFVRNLMNEFKLTAYDEQKHTGMLRHLLIRKNKKEEYMVVFIVNENKQKELLIMADKLVKRYPNIKSIIVNINKDKNNIILGQESKVIYGTDYLIEEINETKFKMSHKAFFQINHDQTEKLYAKALEFADIKPNDTVLDCFCGVGTISLLASKKAQKVYGIEVVEEAINDANENAKLNKINNCQFITGKAEEEIKNINDKIDILFVDPPRKGLEKTLIDAILSLNIPKIVYVSCDIATMSRDIEFLLEKYSISQGIAVDLFPRTANVETVIMLSRNK